MNAEELRATQAPLKQLYRDQPDAARVAGPGGRQPGSE